MTKDFQIDTYLKKMPSDSKNGLCKVCNSKVFWGRDRVMTHKSKNCKGISESERLWFSRCATNPTYEISITSGIFWLNECSLLVSGSTKVSRFSSHVKFVMETELNQGAPRIIGICKAATTNSISL